MRLIHLNTRAQRNVPLIKDPARAFKLVSRNKGSLDHLTRQYIGSEYTRHGGGRNDNILAKQLMKVSDKVRYLVQKSLWALLNSKEYRRAQIWALQEALSVSRQVVALVRANLSGDCEAHEWQIIHQTTAMHRKKCQERLKNLWMLACCRQ